MGLTGLRPSQLDVDTVAALKTKLEIHSYSEIGDELSPMMYGQGLVNIRRKLNAIADYGKPASSIRVAVFGDSILNGTVVNFIVSLFEEWGVPAANIDINCVWGGYEVSSYLPCLDVAVIKPNVDLFFFSDEPNKEIRDQMIAKVRATTNADIMFGTWSMNEAMGFPRYNNSVDIAKKYQCELWDINALLLRKYADGTYLDYMQGVNNVHLDPDGAAYVCDDIEKHFKSDRYYNNYVNADSIRETFIHLGAEFLISVNGITFSGTWSVLGASGSGDLAYAIRSSTATNYIEFTFTGIGFEMLFLDSGTQNEHTILVDGAAPSAYSTNILEYCTQIIGVSATEDRYKPTHRFFAAYVTAQFMTNDEEEVKFTITLGTPVRDGGGILTSLPYTLSQGEDTLGTGNIFTDSTFTFRTTGEITIPALVYGQPNYIEWGGSYLFYEGDTMQFFARKTWKDTIDTNAETFLRIAGLARASHTVRITKEDNVATDAVYLSLYK